MSQFEYQSFYRRHLPHVQPPGATLFVTLRLTGSIPQGILEKLGEEARRLKGIVDQIADRQDRDRSAYAAERRLFGQWDAALDAGKSGPMWLRDSRIASLVAKSCHHHDDRTYTLNAFCIMPNHVHLVCTPLVEATGSYHAISAIMHSLKGHTAHEANQILERTGTFWQHESYDHVIRDEDELRRIITYVLNNPVKAGLVDHAEHWEWSYSTPSYRKLTFALLNNNR